MEPPNLKEVFNEALGRAPGPERSAYLEQACRGNAALRTQVEELLRHHEQLGQFLDSAGPIEGTVAATPNPGLQAAPPPKPLGTDQPGRILADRYKLLERIGEGGMGTVWMAQQTEPVKRLVALKVIKSGMDSHQVLARFEAERQALAMMDHPNIAKVHDAGVTPDGRPFFAMELVKGVPITRYCDEHRLTPRQRLELFVPVCQAIQHAHQKGIIHRDLKPSNVLVALYDDRPVPKVIDFGVAKSTGHQLTEQTLYTGFGFVVGTIEYMSPEQASFNQLDVDTRSDIYSLGVLLYELLAGSPPFVRRELERAGMLDVLRVIREQEPPKPSTRLSTAVGLPTLAANRGTEPRRLAAVVRGELDWIVMKALEKDRARRYATANGLATDLQRYLADEPVQACPPSASYRLRKFARKYRTPLRIAGVFVVFLVLAAALSMWQAARATLAERRALVERDRAEASFRMARDAVDRLFTQVGQSPKLKVLGMEKFRKDLLQNAKEFYERFIREQFDAPGVRHDLGLAHLRLAEIDRDLGENAAAEELLAKALALFKELVRAHPQVAEYQRDLAASYATLGLVYFDTTRWEEANTIYQRALAIQEKQAGAYPEKAEYRYALAKTYGASGRAYHRAERLDSATERYRQALDILTKLVQDFPQVSEHQWLMATTQMNLGQLCITKGSYEEAETALKDAQSIYGRLAHDRTDLLPMDWQSLARGHAMLGMAYRERSQDEKSEAAVREALQMFEKLAQEHPDVQEYTYDVGRCYFEWARTAERGGRTDTALERYDKAIEIMKGARGKGYLAAQTAILDAQIDRAGARAERGEHARATDEAQALARQGNLNSVSLYDIGCVFSKASAAVDRDTKLSPADCARLRAQYADRAMDFLHQAAAKGLDPRVIKNDPDVDPLRAREDFQKLLVDLEGKAKE